MGRASRAKKERSQLVNALSLWHYTTDQHFLQISKSGVIRLTDVYIESTERPAVWLSSNPDWEKTVTKRLVLMDESITDPLSRDELPAYGVTPVRIKIDHSKLKILDWKKFKRVSGISFKFAKSLEDTGRDAGANPDEWYATFEEITADKWISIDFWNGSEWISYNMGE